MHVGVQEARHGRALDADKATGELRDRYCPIWSDRCAKRACARDEARLKHEIGTIVTETCEFCQNKHFKFKFWFKFFADACFAKELSN